MKIMNKIKLDSLKTDFIETRGGRTHGLSHTRSYKSWNHMMDRCYKQSNHAYKTHGGRGIFVCKRWKKFENFYEDMGERDKGYVLFRKDVDKGFSLENCSYELVKNKSKNRLKFIEILKGVLYGDLLTIQEIPKIKTHKRSYGIYFLCKCKCGEMVKTTASLLRTGKITSCKFCKYKSRKRTNRMYICTDCSKYKCEC